MGRPRFQTVFVVSLPRSGSTVLTHLLDRKEDVLALPESFFPAALDLVEDGDFSDKALMAGLFVASCSDGSPLTVEEALDCIGADRLETLDRLAAAIAVKSGRDPDRIRIVIWKFTRMVGCWGWAAKQGGRFLILRRPLLNVFESQFRVDFGRKNRNPLRFALFAASYARAFRAYPKDRTMELDYACIPERIDEVSKWIGSTAEHRSAGRSAVEMTAGRNEWHAAIGEGFENRDAEKLKNVSGADALLVRLGTALFKGVPGLAGLSRRAADRRQFRALMERARTLASPLTNPKETP